MGAICQDCKQDMMKAKSCTVTHLRFPNGEVFERRKDMYGDKKCHDCGITKGGYHHAGCDNERCPRCGGQLISCDCWDETQGLYEISLVKKTPRLKLPLLLTELETEAGKDALAKKLKANTPRHQN